MNYFVYIQLKGARRLPLNDIITLGRLMLEPCILFLIVLVEFLVLLAIRIKPGTVIEELREGVGKHLEDADDNERHNNPLGNFKEQGLLNNLAEAKAANEHNHGDSYRRPKHKFSAKCLDIHNHIS